jgi:hypothetical protein
VKAFAGRWFSSCLIFMALISPAIATWRGATANRVSSLLGKTTLSASNERDGAHGPF